MLKQPFSKQDLYKLFTVCAFPIHAWAILMWLRQTAQIYKRTNLWDALGVGAYEMTFALFETTVVFVIVLLIGLLLPKRLKGENFLAQVSMSVLALSLWAITDRLHVIYKLPIPEAIWNIVLPLLLLVLLVIVLVSITKNEKFPKAVASLLNGIVLLATLYLVFDVLGLLFVILRNLWRPG